MSHEPGVNRNDKFEMKKNNLKIFMVKEMWYDVYKGYLIINLLNKIIKQNELFFILNMCYLY